MYEYIYHNVYNLFSFHLLIVHFYSATYFSEFKIKYIKRTKMNYLKETKKYMFSCVSLINIWMSSHIWTFISDTHTNIVVVLLCLHFIRRVAWCQRSRSKHLGAVSSQILWISVFVCVYQKNTHTKKERKVRNK